MRRRRFLANSGKLMSAALLAPILSSCYPVLNNANSTSTNSRPKKPMFFDISLAQWSMHRQLQNGTLKVLDFPVKTKQIFDIDAVEYVNQFFMDKAKDKAFLNALKVRAEDHEVKNLLIMIDAEGDLGASESAKRTQAIENHYQWVEAAHYLGCHSIRVNAAGSGNIDEVQKNCVDGLRRLSKFARDYTINVIVENHGGYSSNGRWLASVINDVGLPNCGTLPDFGNFGEYDRYQGVKDLVPFAKGISAKSFDFDNAGNETNTDFLKMLKIIKAANYNGYIGIEYEGSGDEDTGIIATRDLLRKLGAVLS